MCAWSSGTFSRAYGGATGCADDEAASIGIVSTTMDNRLNDLATGINTCLTKDGQNAATANLPMGGFLHTNVGAATARTHYARASQVQDSTLIWGGTTGGSANAQTLSVTPAITAYATGQRFAFIAGFTPTAAFTLNFNSLGAKNVFTSWGAAAGSCDMLAGHVYEVVYDGTQFRLINPFSCARRVGSAASIASSAAETSLISFTIPGGLLSVGRAIRYTLNGQFLNNTGSNNGVTLRVKYGATTLITDAVNSSVASSGSQRLFLAEALIGAGNATNVQRCQYSSFQSALIASGNAYLTTGTGPVHGYGSAAEDSTADKTFTVTAQLSANSASLTFDGYYQLVEFI